MEKIDELYYIKIKNFSASKDTIKMKTEATDQEKIHANHIFNKGLESRIYKNSLRNITHPTLRNKQSNQEMRKKH